ncbi:hypothetical protein JCM3770_003167 [Rhodotorula araucariae]
MTDIVSQRRGSAASSVSVTIETTTTTTMATPSTSPVRDSTHSTVSPCPSSRRPSVDSLPLPPPPAATSDSIPSGAILLPYAFPPPPPYTLPHVGSSAPHPSRATISPLSFFALTAPAPLPSSPAYVPARPKTPPPPSYAATPRTTAERLFWRGFLLPLLWIAGARRIWASERPAGCGSLSAGGAAKDDETTAAGACAPDDVREARARWRDEELVWAKRCAWALAALAGVALVFGMAIASMLGAW